MQLKTEARANTTCGLDLSIACDHCDSTSLLRARNRIMVIISRVTFARVSNDSRIHVALI